MKRRVLEDHAFRSGEAEGMVKRLRSHLRSSIQAHERGQATHAHETQASALLAEITDRLLPRYEQYARGYFRGKSEETIEDAISEMVAETCRKVNDLSPTNALFEVKFNLCIKRAIFTAVKKVRRENGLDEDGKPCSRDQNDIPYTIVSLDDATVNASGEDAPCMENRIEDSTSREPFAESETNILTRQLLDRMPNPRQRQVFIDYTEGQTWGEIAARAGVSIRTANSDLEKARKTLLAHYEHGKEEWAQ